MKGHLVLVTASGPDHPGITSSLTKCLYENECPIEDMGQSIIHGPLSLSFLIRVDSNVPDDHPVFKDLLFNAKKMKMQLDFKPIEDKKVIQPKGDQYILNCVNTEGISPGFIHDIANTLASYDINIQKIENLKKDEFVSLEMTALAPSKKVEWQKVKSELITISNRFHTDIALQKDNIWRRNKRLIVFDMDSTLIQSEVIVEMAKVHGVGDEVHKITEAAMNGEFDFDESLRKRVSLLKGLEESKLEDILGKIKLTEGVEDFIKTVKGLGYKVAIISGGFNFCANFYKYVLGLDYAFANELEIKNGKLTGNVVGPIVNAAKKAEILETLSQAERIKLEQVVAIGDGANDLEMLAKAGLGIAFHAKEVVKKSAGHHMSHGPMTTILYFLGIPGAGSHHDV